MKNRIRQVLREERGFVKPVEKWANYVVEQVIRVLFTDSDQFTLHLTDLGGLYTELPINDIIINIDLTRTGGDDGGANAGYLPHLTELKDGKLHNINLNLDLDLPSTATMENTGDVLKDYLQPMFTHEFLHVYEWYKRGQGDPAERKDCMWVYQQGNMYGNIVEKMAYLMYVQSSFEMNAFVHQSSSMLRKMNIQTQEEFKEALEGIFIWDAIVGMSDFNADETYEEIQNMGSEEIVNLTLIKQCYYSPKNPKGDTKDFLNDLQKTFNERGDKLKRKMYRIASDILQ